MTSELVRLPVLYVSHHLSTLNLALSKCANSLVTTQIHDLGLSATSLWSR